VRDGAPDEQGRAHRGADTDTRLKTFIAQWQGKPHSQFGWGDDLTPRLVKGNEIMDYARGVDLSGKVVWGKDATTRCTSTAADSSGTW